MTVYNDFETRSRLDIRFGTDLYTDACEPLILTFARDESAPVLWDIIGGEPMHRDLKDAIRDPKEIFIAHNAQFDRIVWKRKCGVDLPLDRWRCTMAAAYGHGLPGSLGVLGPVLNLPADQQKDLEDAKLIDLFCIPNSKGEFYDRTTHPAEWDRFCHYGIQDTIALREIHRRLPTHNFRGINLSTWWLDQKINERGFGFDQPLARAARDVLEAAKGRHDAEMAGATEGAVDAATQRDRLLAWLGSSGLALPNLRASTIREYLESDSLRPEHRFILELRLEASKSSGSKYRRGLEMVGAGSRVRFGIQFSGAGRTGRFSGRGFQVHNMPRPTTTVIDAAGKRRKKPVKSNVILNTVIPGIRSGDVLDFPEIYGGPNEACSNAIRGCVVPAAGNEFVVADWSNIESRILAWIAGEDWKLDAYRAVDRGTGTDLYKLLFSQFFGGSPDDVDDQQRQSGKVSELAFGFGGGVGALVTMAAGYEMDLDPIAEPVLARATPERLKKAEKAWSRAFLTGEDYGLNWRTYMACDVLKQAYRASNKGINDLRFAVDNAVLDAMRNPGAVHNVAKCIITKSGNCLVIQLPSGRRLLYWFPKLHTEKVIFDPETGKESTVEYVSHCTARGKSWIRERAWSGLYIENIVQGIAADILRCGLDIAHEETLKVPEIADYLALIEDAETAIAFHVHDEIGLDVPKGSYPLARLIANLTTDLLAKFSWTRGLPLAAAGWVGDRGRKG